MRACRDGGGAIRDSQPPVGIPLPRTLGAAVAANEARRPARRRPIVTGHQGPASSGAFHFLHLTVKAAALFQLVRRLHWLVALPCELVPFLLLARRGGSPLGFALVYPLLHRDLRLDAGFGTKGNVFLSQGVPDRQRRSEDQCDGCDDGGELHGDVPFSCDRVLQPARKPAAQSFTISDPFRFARVINHDLYTSPLGKR